MRLAYYLKVFIAFILFGIILIGFSLYISTSFFQTNYEKISVQNAKKLIKLREKTFHRFIHTNDKKITAIAKSEAFEEYLNKKSNTRLTDLFKTAIVANEDLVEIKVLDLKGNELLRVDKVGSNAIVLGSLELENRSKNAEFLSMLNSNPKRVWHSAFDLNVQQGELVYPIEPVISFSVRIEDRFLMMVLDAKKIFGLLMSSSEFNFNIVNEKGEFIVHKNPQYNWSKYFYADINVKESFDKEASYILNENVYIGQKFISKRIYVDKTNFVVFIIEFNKSALETTFDEYGNSIYVILSLTLLLSIFLAVVFSNPIANLNKKLEEEKDSLNLSVLKNSERLDDSLALIDKYVMYITLDKNGTIIDVSSSFCYVSGFDKSELVGEEYIKLLHPDFELSQFHAIWKKLIHGKKWHGEIKNIKKHGGHYWVESFFEPNFDENGKVLSITEIRNNITDKKIIQNLYNDINYQIEQLNAVFQSADSGIVLLDEEGNLKKVNVAFCKLLAYSHDVLLQRNLLEMVLPVRKKFLEKIFDEAKEFGSISNIETIFMCKNNDEVHVNLSLRMLPDKKHIVMVANSLEDKRKLQELNLNLEQRVHEEVEKNIEKDRIHQEEQIQNAKLTSIGSLAAGITHEINTPLTYLKGNFEMMQYDIDALPDCEEKSNMKEDSERITDAINRIANIVESMREMSQSSTEVKENINLYSTIITSLTMAYNMSKQVSRIYVNGKLFTINSLDKNEYEFFSHVQKQRVEQVWIIIINNAIDELSKVSDYEDRLLEIKMYKEDNHIVVRFQDNAGGISAQILPKIFEPFMSTKNHAGMGIGLNIAKKIIEEQQGEIQAFNEHDGALFEVRLPLLENA